jgi:GT2 family glycosyltransferase
MEPGRISVVIVSYNRVDPLRRSLAALSQSPPNEFQVLVVDNGSRDGSASLDDEFPTVRFIRLPRNFGLTRALNIGIRAADGDYVLLLHDDVCIDGAAVAALTAFLENRPDVGAVCPLLNTPQVRPLPTPSHADPAFQPAGGGEGDDEITAECVSGAAIMVRTTFLRSLGHIDERYGNYGSDIELCAQVRSSNRKRVILRSVTATHGNAPSPMPKSALEGDRAAGTAAFIGKHYGFASGLLYRIRSSLVALVTFRFASLPGGKIDGSG